MAEMQQPKKVTGGAFGRFLNEQRSELLKECSGQPATAVVKLASERFKALGEAEKAEYQEKYSKAVEQYNKDMEAFLAAGGEKAAVKRKGKKGEEGAAKKRKKDPEAPKKPAGGGYGCYLAKHRAEFQEQTKGQGITAVAKLAGEKWRQLSEEEKKPFEEEFTTKMEAYKAAMKDYVPPEEPEPKVDKKAAAKQAKEEAKEAKKQAKEEAKEAKSSAKAKAKAKAAKAPKAKAKAKAKAKVKAFARGRLSKSKPAMPKVELQTSVAAKAEKEGLTDKLTNLASRQDIIDSKKSQASMLKALQESGGLIHPARRALLGA